MDTFYAKIETDIPVYTIRIMRAFILGFILLILGFSRTSFADLSRPAAFELSCIPAMIAVMENRIVSRFSQRELDYIGHRIRRNANQSVLRRSIPALQSILSKPESQISAEELQVLREIQSFFADQNFGIRYLGRRIQRKIDSVEYFQASRLDGIQFRPRAERDLRRLSSTARESVENEIIPNIKSNPQVGDTKVNYPNSMRVVRFYNGTTYYRLAYEILENSEIEIIMIGSRQNFYEELARRY